MNLVSRFLGSSVGGGAIAIAMTLGMAALIRTEFEAQEKYEVEIGDINPISDDIQPPDRVEIVPKKLKRIEVPPPPPSIDTVKATTPSEPIADLGDMIPDMDTTIFEGGLMIPAINVIDQEVSCTICVAPQMPVRATKSGHCKLSLSVSNDGSPYNVKIKYCSENLFARNSIKAAQRFKYQPKIQGGQAVEMHGAITTITYELTDERGRLIPE